MVLEITEQPSFTQLSECTHTIAYSLHFKLGNLAMNSQFTISQLKSVLLYMLCMYQYTWKGYMQPLAALLQAKVQVYQEMLTS